MCIGSLHINYNDLYAVMDLRIVVNAMRAFYHDRESELTEHWRMVRSMELLYYNSKVKKGEQITDPRKFMLLPGEVLPKPRQLSTKQIDKLLVSDG